MSRSAPPIPARTSPDGRGALPYSSRTGLVDRISSSIPLGRMAEPREVAEVAAWILGDRASMVTGAIVPLER